MEVVTIVRVRSSALKRVDLTKTTVTPTPVVKAAVDTTESDEPARTLEAGWEELRTEKGIHKACQAMRDIDRADRKDREERRRCASSRRMEV
jgi:uncharacterized protein YwlG (UPF0340 family)